MSVVGEQSTDRLLELLSRGKLRPTEVRGTKCRVALVLTSAN